MTDDAPVARTARAHHALNAVGGVAAGQVKDYATRAQNLPAMIQNLGLAGTVAFLLSKQESRTNAPGRREVGADVALADHLAGWLLDTEAGIPWPPGTDRTGGDEAARRLEEAVGDPRTSWLVYRQAAREARHYAGWLKRVSKARIP